MIAPIIFVGVMVFVIVTCLCIKPKRKWNQREWESEVFDFPSEEEF